MEVPLQVTSILQLFSLVKRNVGTVTIPVHTIWVAPSEMLCNWYQFFNIYWIRIVEPQLHMRNCCHALYIILAMNSYYI